MAKTKRHKEMKRKAKATKPSVRLVMPPNKRHKSKKDYKRNNKVKPHEVE